MSKPSTTPVASSSERRKIIATTWRSVSHDRAKELEKRLRRIVSDVTVIALPGAGMLRCMVTRPDDGRPVSKDAPVECIFRSAVEPRQEKEKRS